MKALARVGPVPPRRSSVTARSPSLLKPRRSQAGILTLPCVAGTSLSATKALQTWSGSPPKRLCSGVDALLLDTVVDMNPRHRGDLFVDPQSRRLAGDAQDTLTNVSWPVSLAPTASTVQRIPVYPTVTLPAGPGAMCSARSDGAGDEVNTFRRQRRQ